MSSPFTGSHLGDDGNMPDGAEDVTGVWEKLGAPDLGHTTADAKRDTVEPTAPGSPLAPKPKVGPGGYPVSGKHLSDGTDTEVS